MIAQSPTKLGVRRRPPGPRRSYNRAGGPPMADSDLSAEEIRHERKRQVALGYRLLAIGLCFGPVWIGLHRTVRGGLVQAGLYI